MKPCRLSFVIRHNEVLGLDARAREEWLPVRGPRDKTITKEHGVAQGGLVHVRTADLVGIGVDDEVCGRRSSKKEEEVDGPWRYHRIRFIGVRCGFSGACI